MPNRLPGRYVGHLHRTWIAPVAGSPSCLVQLPPEVSREVIRRGFRGALLRDFRQHGAEVIAKVEASDAEIDDAPGITDDELTAHLADWRKRGRQAIIDLARDRPDKFIAIVSAIANGEL